jgi:hypothetical protein
LDEEARALLHELDLGKGARPEALVAAEHELGIKFPSDYAEFTLAYDGGEGTLGSGYLQLYSLGTLLEVNREWRSEGTGGKVLFGSDGGGEGYAFDIGQDTMAIIQLPMVAPDPEDEITCGQTLGEFLVWVSEGRG